MKDISGISIFRQNPARLKPVGRHPSHARWGGLACHGARVGGSPCWPRGEPQRAWRPGLRGNRWNGGCGAGTGGTGGVARRNRRQGRGGGGAGCAHGNAFTVWAQKSRPFRTGFEKTQNRANITGVPSRSIGHAGASRAHGRGSAWHAGKKNPSPLRCPGGFSHRRKSWSGPHVPSR